MIIIAPEILSVEYDHERRILQVSVDGKRVATFEKIGILVTAGLPQSPEEPKSEVQRIHEECQAQVERTL